MSEEIMNANTPKGCEVVGVALSGGAPEVDPGQYQRQQQQAANAREALQLPDVWLTRRIIKKKIAQSVLGNNNPVSRVVGQVEYGTSFRG